MLGTNERNVNREPLWVNALYMSPALFLTSIQVMDYDENGSYPSTDFR